MNQLDTPVTEKAVTGDKKRVRPLAGKDPEGFSDLADGGGVADLDLEPDGASRRRHVPQRRVGLTSTATRVAAGIRSRSKVRRFAANSAVKKLIPVAFPPGRARLRARPSLTGSSLTAKAMGIVVVAALAANTAAGANAAMTETRRRTSSAARPGSRSLSFSAERYSIATFSPSI